MKKTTAILLISFFVLYSVFASSAEVQLTNTINDSDIEYQLYYNNGTVISGETNEIVVASLTQDSNTEDFYINATYNKNKGATISVDINPSEFVTTLNGNNDEISSGITPNIIYYNSNKTKLDAGRHVDKTVFKFYFEWSGNPNLAAGNYISNVEINYTIE